MENNQVKKDKTPNGSGGWVKVKANVSLVLRDKDGKIKDERKIKNIVVTVGFNEMIKQVMGDVGGGAQPDKFNYIGIGTGNTAEVVGDTALETEIGTRVVDTTPSFPLTGKGEIVSLFPPGNGTGDIKETGLLNASSGGTLLARKTFATISKLASDSLQVTWAITLS